MSGGGGRTTVQRSTSAPWGPMQDFVRRSGDKAWEYLEDPNIGYEPYQGSTVAPYSAETQAGISGMFGQAQRGAPGSDAALAQAQQAFGAAGSGLQTLTDTASGKFLDSPNPYLMQRLGSAADQVTNRINQQFAGAGRTGSGAMQDRLAGSLGDLYSGALSQDYSQERGRQMQAAGQLQNLGLSYAGMVPGLEAAQYNPYQQMLSAGALRDDLAAREIQDKVRIDEGTRQAPWTELANYSGIVNQGGALGGQGTTTVQQPGTSPWLSALYGGSALLGGLGSVGRGFGFGG